jgi:prolyl-tRNA synthetase
VDLLDEIQKNIFDKAFKFREGKITSVSSWDEFREVLDNKGGFISAYWDGTVETELKIKEETKATIRCIPLDSEENTGTDVYSGKTGKFRVLYARAY